MGAVRRAKGVVYENIRKACQRLGKFRVVFGFFLVITHVFKQGDFAVLKRCGNIFSIVADDVAAHTNGLPKQLGKPYRYRRKAEFGQPFALRTTEMRAKNNPCPVLNKIFYGGQRRHNAFVICDDAVLQRNVEIAAHQNALALYVNIPYGHFVCSVHKSLPFCK